MIREKDRKYIEYYDDIYPGQMVRSKIYGTSVPNGRIAYRDGYILIANNLVGEIIMELYGFTHGKIIGYTEINNDGGDDSYIALEDNDVEYIYEHEKSKELIWDKRLKH